MPGINGRQCVAFHAGHALRFCQQGSHLCRHSCCGIGGVGHKTKQVLPITEKPLHAMPHMRRYKAATATQCLKNPKIQIPVLTVIEQDPPLREQLTIIPTLHRKPRQIPGQRVQKGGAPWCGCIDITHKKAIPLFAGCGVRPVLYRGKGGEPPDALLRQEWAVETGLMVMQGDKANVKGLCVPRLPTVDVRIHTVKNRQAGKVLHAKHKGRAAFVRHHQHIRGKARQPP